MKLKKAIIPIILAILTIAGCGDKNTEKVDNIDYTESNKINQYSASVMRASPGENGLFYMQYNYMKYYDADIDNSMYVCSKAECTHDTEDCNAYTEGYLNIISYNGKLYFIQCKDAVATLCRSELDGSSREELVDLFYYIGASYGANMVITGEYAYITVLGSANKTWTAEVYRVKLEKDAELELILSGEEDVNESYIECWSYTPEYMLFDRESYIDGSRVYEIFLYDIENNEMTKLPYQDSPGTIVDNNVYISNGPDIVKYNIEDKTEEVVIPGMGAKQVFYDGQYIYLNNAEETYKKNQNHSELRLYVYNLECEKIDEIDVGRGDTDKLKMVIYGGGDELWIATSQEVDGKEKRCFAYYKKSELGTGKQELYMANNTFYSDYDE